MDTRNNKGRPTKYSDSIVREFERAFRIGLTDQKACEYVGVNPDTYYQWCNKKKGFSERICRAKLFIRIKAGQIIANKIVKDKDVDSAKWWLARKHKDEFSDRIGEKESIQRPIIVRTISYADPDGPFPPKKKSVIT